MNTPDKAAPESAEKKTTASAERRAYDRRVAASKSGDEHFGKRRLHERFKVADARVLLAIKNMIGLWKVAGPPCIVKNLGIGGISFFTHSAGLKPGQRVRLSLHVPRKPSLPLKGRVTHILHHQNHTFICGVAFTDYGVSAWGTLCDLYNEHAGDPATAEHPAQSSS